MGALGLAGTDFFKCEWAKAAPWMKLRSKVTSRAIALSSGSSLRRDFLCIDANAENFSAQGTWIALMWLFNTATHRIDTFAPIDPSQVRMYCCGPTVYAYAQVGNL
jgi:hypothetical protein